MPPTPAVTRIHQIVDSCRADDFPARVVRLRSGWVIMGERQIFSGYCLLLPDPVVGHLNVLDAEPRALFLSDLGLLGDAVLKVTGAIRINYAMFGNVEPALHAHVIPRFDSEPEATRTAQPWAFDWTAAPEFSPTTHGALQRRIANELLPVALKS